MIRAFACVVRTAMIWLLVSVPAFSQNISFLPPQNYSVGDDPRSAAFGDFNSDGRRDVVIANSNGMATGTPTLSVFLGNGNGSFSPFSTIPLESRPYYITSADFNGDSRTDLAFAQVDVGRVSILLSNGNGTFSAAPTIVTSGLPFSVIPAQLNGDSNVDLVASHYQGQSGSSGHVQVLLGNGNGTFTSSGAFGAASAFYSAVADFNGDSRPDIASTRGSAVGLLFGNGDGTFVSGPVVLDVGGRGIVAADFNGDGRQDFASATFDSNSGHIGVALGNGNGTFQPPTSAAAVPWPWGMTGADFNGDGKFDLVSANYGSGTISVLAGNGNGTFQTATNITVGSTPYFAGVSDFNGDSKPDLAVTNAGSNTFSVLLNNATSSESIWNTPVNAIAGQNSLTKFGGCDGCFDAGASTKLSVASGDAFADFSFPETNGFRHVGLSHAFSVTNSSSVDFGIRTQGGWAEVREGGAYKSDISAAAGDIFRISVQSGVVRYAKNGVVFYTSSSPVQYPFVFGAILGTANSGIQGVAFTGSGSPPPPPPPPSPPPPPGGSGPATWTSMSNVSVEGNTVRKTSGCDGCFDAFVQSEQTVGSSGYVEFTIPNPSPFVLAGLAHAFTPGNATSIDFGIRVQGGYAEVRENGVYMGDIAAQAGAVFRISISSGVVSYSKDGFVFYSGPASAGVSSFAVLFGNLDASISNVMISN